VSDYSFSLLWRRAQDLFCYHVIIWLFVLNEKRRHDTSLIETVLKSQVLQDWDQRITGLDTIICKHPSFWVRSFIVCGRACILVYRVEMFELNHDSSTSNNYAKVKPHA
jgi:hypothetical protein